MQKKEKIVISLGGSIIVPEKIDIALLTRFKKLILKHIKTKQFFIITGGGRTAREYAGAAAQIGKVTLEDRDWIGIHCTRLNAHLLRTIFRKYAFKKIIKNPYKKINTNKPVVIGAGYEPGYSSDFDSVTIANNVRARTILNLTNTDYVYNKDPRKHKDAKPFKQLSWKKFRSMIPKSFRYGMHAPFDPIASREAQKLKLKVIIMNGNNTKNIDNFLKGTKGRGFKGTVIE